MIYCEHPIRPDMQRAQQKATLAHNILVKLKEMGLPPELDDTIAAASTDLGDLWSTHTEMSDLVNKILKSPPNWEFLGDTMIDLKSVSDHMDIHARRFRKAADKVARFAYKQSSKDTNITD